MNKVVAWMAMVAITGSLMGCGGGSDDSSSSSQPAPIPPAPTYSITASISGLNAAGLVLQNNGGGSVTVASGATTASIATGVSRGSTYAVTVQTQPTGRFCTVANGGGTINANVSNIAVSCVPVSATTYTVSGTITGYTGSGLGLRLNGDTGPTFNANPASGAVSFAFTAGLTTGTAYTITIPSLPTGPAQACGFTAGQSGTIGNANVSNVAITCINSAAFTVGGTVSGLTGTGLSLRMAYTNQTAPAVLNIAANETQFVFADTIAANGGFGVGILTQPAGQTCTIVRGRGTSTVNALATLRVRSVVPIVCWDCREHRGVRT
jgi:hypothetical protein